MIDLKKIDCTGCSSCYNICPKNCISMEFNDEGFKYPIIDNKNCIECGLCEKSCPLYNDKQREHIIESYACYNKDNDIRMESSSGGIFTLLAQEVLRKKGVVFGAIYDERLNIVHDYTESVDDLYKFRGSKYFQSNIGKSYTKVKNFLNEDRVVLFSGTPCQIQGLIAYLGFKEYENLICVDIICHGVPSKKVWDKYNKDMLGNKVIKNINFRSKINGWETYEIKLDYEDGSEFSQKAGENLFMQGFVNDYYLRSSCYNCKAKGVTRWSDITLGDFWGIDNVLPKLNDKKGTSAVIIQSDKGKKLFEFILEYIDYEKVEASEIAKYNKSLVEVASNLERRNKFFYYIKDFSFNQAIELSQSNSISKFIKFKLRNILK